VCVCVRACVCARVCVYAHCQFCRPHRTAVMGYSNIIQKVAPPGQSNSPVIEVWEDLATLGQVINAGYQAVLAAGNASYFFISSMMATVFELLAPSDSCLRFVI